MKIQMAILLGLLMTGCSKNDQLGSDAPQKVQGNDFGKRTGIVSNDTQSSVGAAPASQMTSSGNQVGGPGDKDPTAVVGTDAELQQRVKVAISTGSTGTQGQIAQSQLSPIEVTASGGTVTLSGPIQASRRDGLLKFVRGLPGVKEVKDNLNPQ